MDFRKGISAILLASLVAAPAALAHDPKEHEREAREAEMKRVPVKIEPAPAPVVVQESKPELPKIRFAEMDKDGDRRITRKEWRGKGSSFRKLDGNKDGVLAGVEVEVRVKARQK